MIFLTELSAFSLLQAVIGRQSVTIIVMVRSKDIYFLRCLNVNLRCRCFYCYSIMAAAFGYKKETKILSLIIGFAKIVVIWRVNSLWKNIKKK